MPVQLRRNLVRILPIVTAPALLSLLFLSLLAGRPVNASAPAPVLLPAAQRDALANEQDALTLTKHALLDLAVVAPAEVANPGDVVSYTLVATNTGAVTLTTLSLVDPLAGALDCTQPVTLPPSQALTCTGRYILQAQDIIAEQVTNTATARIDDLPVVTATVVVTIPTAPALALAQFATPQQATIGDFVTYTLLLTNTGNVPLTATTLYAPRLGLSRDAGLLLPAATAVVTGVYGPIVAGDLPGPLVNTASATATIIRASGGELGPLTSTHALPLILLPAVTMSGTPNPAPFGATVTFTATITAGVAYTGAPAGVITFTLDGAPWAEIPVSDGMALFSTPAPGVGNHVVRADYSGDGLWQPAGSAPLTQTVEPATTTTTLLAADNPSYFGESVTFTATVTANAPGAGTPTGVITFTVDGAPFTRTLSSGVAAFSTASLAAGAHTVGAAYGGDANFAASAATSVTQTVHQAATTTTLLSTPNPAQLGESVIFTATVTANAPGAGTPTGVITFTVDGAPFTRTLGSGIAALSMSGLGVGQHPVTTLYGGDANFAASATAPFTQTVERASTGVVLANLPAATVFGQPVLFTATVTSAQSGLGVPSGVVTFSVGATLLGVVPLDSAGAASVTVAALIVGNHQATATYGGDASFAASVSAPVTHTVDKAATTILLASAPLTTTYGEPIAFTATVSIVAPGAGALSGAVIFQHGAHPLGSAPIDAGGVATFTTTSLPAGSPNVTATYTGDARFAVSVSAPVTHTVHKASTTLLFTTAPNPAPAQTSVVFTAALSVVAPGGGAPTGVITYTAGSTRFTGTLAGGVAVAPLATLPVGTHSVSALYAGDANFLGASATSSDQVVTCLPIATVTSSAESSPLNGGLGTLRRAIADVCTGGSVAFSLTTPATITLSSGQISLTRDVAIDGPGASVLAVSGGGAARLFAVDNGVTASIRGLTLRDGRVNAPVNGGGIYNQGTLVLSDCTLANNRAGNHGGGIYNHTGALAVTGCTFAGNGAGFWGGAVATFYGTLTLTNSAFTGNGAGYFGGGLFVNYGAHTTANNTFTGNSAGQSGGAVAVLNGQLAVTHSTFTGNIAITGGALGNLGGSLGLRSSIVASSIAGGNCAGAITNGGANLDSGATCGVGALSNVNPMLAALADNGGPTWTLGLLPGSPALDAGDAAFCAAPPVESRDQRGVARPHGAGCDIGAFESRGFDLLLSGSPQSALIGNPFPAPLQVTVHSSAGEPVGPGGLVALTPPAAGAGLDTTTLFTLSTDANGVINVAATANMEVGNYLLTVTTRGATAPAAFDLANVLRGLRVHKIGDGAGLLSSAPAGIACGLVCLADIRAGTVVTVTATPESGSTIGGWEGCETPPVSAGGLAQRCRVTVQEDSNVTTTFILNQYPVEIHAAPEIGGIISGGGLYKHGYPVIVGAAVNPGYRFVNWTEQSNEVSAETHYEFTATVTRSLTANFTTTLPAVVAVNDAAGVLAGQHIDIPVLANDRDYGGAGLAVLAVSTPAHGVATLNPGNLSVRYLAAADFSGVERFTYVVQDGNGYTATATVAVVARMAQDAFAAPQVAVVIPAVQSRVHFTDSQGMLAVELPAGFYTGALQAGDLLLLSYTPIVTPTEHVSTPPGGLKFGNLAFELTLFRNEEPLPSYAFAAPLLLTLRYNPALLGDADRLTLQLFRWDGAQWSTDGLALLSHDVVSSTFVAALRHLSEFAFFSGDALPLPERLYLPAVTK